MIKYVKGKGEYLHAQLDDEEELLLKEIREARKKKGMKIMEDN